MATCSGRCVHDDLAQATHSLSEARPGGRARRVFNKGLGINGETVESEEAWNGTSRKAKTIPDTGDIGSQMGVAMGPENHSSRKPLLSRYLAARGSSLSVLEECPTNSLPSYLSQVKVCSIRRKKKKPDADYFKGTPLIPQAINMQPPL